MKISSIKYLTGEGVKNIWINRLMTFASVGVLTACMILIGLAVLLSFNVNKTLGELEQQNVIMVYFDDYNCALYSDTVEKDQNGNIPEDAYKVHNDEEALEICDKIKALPNISSVEYISSEQGLLDVKNSMLEGQEKYFEFLDEDNGNPLSCAARVSMLDLSQFKDTIESIKQIDGVDTIQSQNDLAEKITSIKNAVTFAGIWLIVILLIISLIIVSNTIRVTMNSRKLEITIMKAVGATDSFVRIPFIVEGVAIGIISAIISEIILYFSYRGIIDAILSSSLETNGLISFSSVALLIFGIFILIGVLAGSLGSLIIMSKYLRKEGSEFNSLF